MRFKIEPPECDGYYYVLDVCYPIVKIAYVYRLSGFVWIHGFDRGDDFPVTGGSPMRFGDKIEIPRPAKIE